jgi:Peptidase family M23/PGAP1-like protein
VRSAAAGEVIFSGRVAGPYAVTIAHAGGLETTYSQLADVFVEDGQLVGAGHWIGEVDRPHAGAPAGLHFGVKIEGAYVDPVDFLGSSDVGEAIHLVAIDDSDVGGTLELAWAGSGARLRPCAPPGRPPATAPNDNIAVVIAGISSETANGSDSPFFSFADRLGYGDSDVYKFSYRSLEGPRGHEPYTRFDTNRSLLAGARRLGDLLRLIANRHPGKDIDILAHSQGGIIARAYLAGLGREWTHADPRVEHLVTLATPHRGARLAHLADDLRGESLTGGLVARAVGWWSRHGGPLPDPDSPAARELRTDSALMQWLASEDVAYGTRVLALSVPDDLVVTANRAVMRHELNRVVPPAGLRAGVAPRVRPEYAFIDELLQQARRLNRGPVGWLEVAADVGPEAIRAARAHFQIIESAYARALTHGFLSDRLDPCPSAWDDWGVGTGMMVDAAESHLGWAYGEVESLIAQRLRVGVPYEAARFGQRLIRALRGDRDRGPSGEKPSPLRRGDGR